MKHIKIIILTVFVFSTFTGCIAYNNYRSNKMESDRKQLEQDKRLYDPDYNTPI